MAVLEFGGWLAKKAGDIALKSLKVDEIDSAFKKALRRVAKKVKQEFPQAFGGDVVNFLQNEVLTDELIKVLFVDHEIDIEEIEKYIDTSTLPDNFLEYLIKTLREDLLSDRKLNLIFSNKLIYNEIVASSNSINCLIEKSDEVIVRLKDIRENLELKFKEKFSYGDFLNMYFENLKILVNDVNFFGLGIEQTYKKPRIQIDKIFIKPIFRYTLQNTENDDLVGRHCPRNEDKSGYHDLNTGTLLSFSKNLVILGEAGAGKSLFVKAIMFAISRKDSIILGCSSIFSFVPIRIELRRYLAFKKRTNKSIIYYILEMFETEYSINFLTVSDIDYILRQENIIMLFDGLDEIFDINDKNNTKNDIVLFTKSYLVRTIVTSRIKGYEDAKLPIDYLEFSMVDFNESQINEYATKWYSFEEDNIEIRNFELEEFKRAKASLSNELLKNPLLLSLIVILYRNNLRLPESKLEIYQSCTKTLVDKWDSIKQLDISINADILSRKETILADLAFWQYELSSNHPDQINFNTALSAVSSSIATRLRMDDWVYIDNIARPFMEYLEKRSIYFENNFTHKTFLEYFTAFWIYSNCDKKHFIEKRDQILDRYINNSFWYIVFELLLNMIDNNQSDEDIMDGIYERQISRGVNTYEFLLSALPSIKNISKQTISTFIEKIIILLSSKIDQERKRVFSKDDESIEHSIFDYLQKLIGIKRFLSIFVESTKKMIEESENDNDKNKILSLACQSIKITRRKKDVRDALDLKGYEDILRLDSFTHVMLIFSGEKSSFEDFFDESIIFIGKHGYANFFKALYPSYAKWVFVPLSDNLIFKIIADSDLDKFDSFIDKLLGTGVPMSQFVKRLSSEHYHFGYMPISRVISMVKFYVERADLMYRSILLVLIKGAFGMYKNNRLVGRVDKSENIKEVEMEEIRNLIPLVEDESLVTAMYSVLNSKQNKLPKVNS